MKIAELFAEVGFKFDSIKLREVSKIIGDLNLSSIISAASVGALGETIGKLTQSTLESASALTTLNKATGIDPTFIQRFEKFSLALGSTKQEADSFLSTLSKIQLQISQGKGGETPFIMMGINPQGKTKEELAQLINDFMSNDNSMRKWAGTFAKGAKSKEEILAAFKAQIGNEVGLSDSMLKTMSDSRFKKEMSDQSSFLTMSKETILQANAATFEWVKATENLNQQFHILAYDLLPMITGSLEAFSKSGILKTIGNVAHATGTTIDTISQAASIDMTNLKAMFMNIHTDEQLLKLKYARQIQGSGINPNVTNHVNVTVQANDPHEFTKAFKPHLEKLFASTDIQFGYST